MFSLPLNLSYVWPCPIESSSVYVHFHHYQLHLFIWCRRTVLSCSYRFICPFLNSLRTNKWIFSKFILRIMVLESPPYLSVSVKQHGYRIWQLAFHANFWDGSGWSAAWVLRGSKISCDWCLSSVSIGGICCLFRANEHFDFADEI